MCKCTFVSRNKLDNYLKLKIYFMNIIITGSLGNVAKPLAQKLIKENHEITIISSNDSKKQEIESLGAKAAIGSMTDVDFLTKTFNNSDAVFLMTPPVASEKSIVKNTIKIGENYAEALKNSGVKKIVMLSSAGAESPVDNGPIASLHHIEKLYRNLEISVTFLRAGYFYLNLLNDIPMIKNAGIIGGNYPENIAIPLVHPIDIANAAAEELVKISSEKIIRYVVGDNRTPSDFAKTLGTVIGKPDLPWVEFTDEQSFEGMRQAGLPEEMAALYVEMGKGLRIGVVQADYENHGSPINAATKLEDFAKEFAKNF